MEQYADEVKVIRNDMVSIVEVAAFDGIILSPGPGLPKNAGKTREVIHYYHRTMKILGICLGHQAIAEYFGAEIYNMQQVTHGISSNMTLCSSSNLVFKGLPQSFLVGRYHSWAVSSLNFPDSMIIDAITDDGIIMALHHKHYAVYGLQFHPESVLSEYGAVLIQNWINLKKNEG